MFERGKKMKTQFVLLRKSFLVFSVSLTLSLSFVSLGGCSQSEPPAPATVVGFPRSFADVAEKVTPAVVNISSTSTVTIPRDLLEQFLGRDEGRERSESFKPSSDEKPNRKLKQQSLGSGIIIDKGGYIITNNHVVDKAEDIKAKLADGREFKAKVIGRDAKTDLALIKISSPFENLPVLALGDSGAMRVGDWVLAVGNPYGLGHTVTQGIISATGRVIGAGPYDDFLQTDAPINPGNSGGPLVNLKGEVVGINIAIVASAQGLGFAIPSKLAKSVTTQLREKGRVVRGWVGVAIQAVTPEIAASFGLKEAAGALVSDVISGSPAEKGGLKQGDIITSYNGKQIKTPNDLSLAVADSPIGKEAKVDVIRNGKPMQLRVRVEELAEKREARPQQNPASTLGMRVENLSPKLRQELRIGSKTEGVVIVDVEDGSPADVAGLEAGDLVREVNRTPVKNVNDYNKALGKTRKGAPVLLLITRGKSTLFVSIQAQ
jgi:serine protease Do